MKIARSCFPMIVILCLLGSPLQAGSAQAAGPAAPESRLLQVVLLLGKVDGSAAMDDIPPNTHKALEDIKNFLPFKSFEMLATTLVRSNGRARTILKDSAGRDYQLELSFLTEPGESTDRLVFQRFLLTKQAGTPVPAPREEGGESPAIAPRADESIISTSFTADVGETIVVGTSRLDGGEEALIVLLTAIP